MMKVVQINATSGTGSTGKICQSISKLLNENNIENYILYSTGKTENENSIKYMNNIEVKIQTVKSRILGNYGFNSTQATNKIIKSLEKIKPDIVHLHNLHAHNCNIGKLFNYFKLNPSIKIMWTFHDCWSFTGYCPHFTLKRCDLWKNECNNCPDRHTYTWFLDRSKSVYLRKKNALVGTNMLIVTPSVWLENLIKKSYLKEYPVKVINNGIDLNIFKPRKSNFRIKYNIDNKKYIVLGVACGWGKRKGLDVFIDLYKRLDKEKYQIVLVGTDKKVDKILPKNVISIHRTNNQIELAEIYTIADVFVNPTREENYPTVNMESIACGTPVITFKTGGSSEILDEKTGKVVDCNDINSMEKEIINVCKNNILNTEDCINSAKRFDANVKFKEYIELYEEIFYEKGYGK